MPSIINATTSTGLVSSADNSGVLQLATNNGTTAVTITTGQNVGIGVTATTQKLWVESGRVGLTNAYKLGWHSNPSAADLNNYITGDDSTNYVAIGTGASERMRINSAGLVSTTGSILSGGYVAGAGYYRSSGMVNETVTVTTEATVYSMNKDSGGGGSSSTSTYNITGLSNTDGSSAIIYVRNSNTAGGVNTVTIVQIHGTKVWEGNVQNTTKTASFGVFRQNGAWQTTAWSTGGVLNGVW
jgi:hypothetical protein